MRDLLILLVHLIATLARLLGPGGLRSVVAESLLVKQQLLILNRSRQRAPNLRASDRILAGVCALFMRPARVLRSAVVLRPSTILDFHRMLRRRKYRWLFSPRRRRTGPKGPSKALVDAMVAMKRHNPRWGCPRIAQQIGLAFDIQIDKDVVRRVLATHYRPGPGGRGPSWLTFLGQTKDSLWSMNLFRCESAILRSHWVLVVMDHYTRRIVGFGVHAGIVDGRALCRMFNHAVRGPSCPTRALVHDSKLTASDPNRELPHRPMLYDSGRPSSVIRFRTLHAITASVTRPPGERARRPLPMIDLYRKKAFSTRACR